MNSREEIMSKSLLVLSIFIFLGCAQEREPKNPWQCDKEQPHKCRYVAEDGKKPHIADPPMYGNKIC